MAEVKRYVNRAADAGGDGTTNGLTGGTAAYQTLNIWEAAEDGVNLVTDGDYHIVECTGTLITQDTTSVYIDGWTTGDGNDITIDGLDALNGYKMEGFVNSGGFISGTEDYVTVKRLNMEVTANGAGNRGIDFNGVGGTAATKIVIDGCNLENSGAGSTPASNIMGVRVKSSINGYVINNFIHGKWGTGITLNFAQSSTGVYYIFNNTCLDAYVDNFTLTGQVGATVRVIGNIGQGGGSNDFNYQADYTYSGNISEDATGPNPDLQSITITFDAANDPHIAPASYATLGASDNLYADGDYAVTVDIDDVARNDNLFDIGADHVTDTPVRVIEKAEATQASGSTTFDIATDWTPADGNLLLAFISKDDDDAITQPSGWTIDTNSSGSINNSHNLQVCWKIASSEGASPTYQWSADSEQWCGVIFEIENAHATVPIDAQSSKTDDTTNTPTSPSITPDANGCLIFAGFGCDDDDTPFTIEAGLVGRTNLTGGTGAGASGLVLGTDYQVTSAVTGTYVHGQGAAEGCTAFTVAVAPVVIGGEQTTEPTNGVIDTVGNVATITFELELTTSPTNGVIDTVGNTPQVDLTVNLLPANGIVTTVGNVPVIEAGTIIDLAPANGVIDETGYAPQVDLTVNLEPANGVVDETGYAPTVTFEATINVAPTNGVETTVGNVATVEALQAAAELAPASGLITTTGLTPVVGLAVTLSPTVGIVETTGNIADVAALSGVNPAPSVGIVNVVGNTPNVELVTNLQPANGIINTTGNLVSVETLNELTTSPTNGVIETTGNTPSVNTEITITSVNGVVNVAGLVPTVQAVNEPTLHPSVGIVETTGNTPSIAATINLEPSNGVINSVGNTPQVDTGAALFTTTPTIGIITTVGLAPVVDLRRWIPVTVQPTIWTEGSAAITIWTEVPDNTTTWTAQ